MRAPDDLSDASCAIAASGGDERAYGALMRRHKAWLYNFIRRYVADKDDAYDILQESFVAAWGALPRFDPGRSFQAWLRQIALNKCRDHARRRAVRRAALKLFGLGAELSGEALAPPPDAGTASGQALKRLEMAVASLPRALKEPLVLTMLEGLSHRDAGEMLGLNAKAVETRVYRAKKRLAELLDPSDLDDLSDR